MIQLAIIITVMAGGKSQLWLTRPLLGSLLCLLYLDAVYAHYCKSKFSVTTDNSPMICFDNESFPDDVTNDEVVVFNSSTVDLSRLISFTSIKNVQFIGSRGTTLIQCEQSAGLIFHQVSNLTLMRMTFDSCTFVQAPSVFVGIYICRSHHITIDDVAITNSPGTGMIIADSYGVVSISNSRFKNNKANSTRGGGGMYIDFSSSASNSRADYHFHGCQFLNNLAKDSHFVFNSNCTNFRLGRGGGMGISFRHNSTNVSVTIQDTSFFGNSASWGGAMTVSVCHSAYNNILRVINCSLENNEAMYDSGSGGGGLDIAFSDFLKSMPPDNNELYFENVTIRNNTGEYGGGMWIYSDYVSENVSNSIGFYDCSWTRNRARFGSAVDISPIRKFALQDGPLPSVTFKDCVFSDNGAESRYTMNQTGYGAILITYFKVSFSGEVSFYSNKYSAIYATSSVVKFTSTSDIQFIGNSGYRGGAVALIDSIIQIDSSSLVTFENNSASFHGSAIYWEIVDLHDFIEYKFCFIQTENSEEQFPNNTLSFIGDKKMEFIYATTLRPCLKMCSDNFESKNFSIEQKLRCIGRFSFSGGDKPLSSETGEFNLNVSEPFEITPGFEKYLPFEIIDDCNQMIQPSVLVMVTDNDSQVSLINSYLFGNKSIQLSGSTGSQAELKFTTEGLRGRMVSFTVSMLPCPPFFNLDDNQRCICNHPHFNYSFYRGVKKCSNNISYIQNGYWIGYEGMVSEEHLIVGYCPGFYCFRDATEKLYYDLPLRANKEELDEKVCGAAHRTDITCSRCRDGYSVHFHSENFECGLEKYCHYGALFYILSEIIPLSIFFIVILVFNVNFTSGELNGFIFFVQVSDLIGDFGKSFTTNIPVSNVQSVFTSTYKLVYRIFNFNFFSIDALSFCLYKGARTIDIIAFKYISVVYGLILFILVILFLKYCRCFCCKWKKINISILHGLTTFFVLVYAQCIKVAFQILNPGYIHHNSRTYRTVVFHQGDMDYLKGKHLLYVFPAVFSLIVINLALPTLLVSYPLSNRIVAFFKLDRFATIRCIARNIPIIKLKPLIDSFQGSFKDKYRFFSGLYFFYRMIILAPRFVNSFLDTYIIFQIEFIFILFIHQLVKPYKRYWHNILDALLLLNLSIINSLNIIIYIYSREIFTDQNKIKAAKGIRLILMYLPLAYIIIRFFSVIMLKILNCYRKPPDQTDSEHELSYETFRNEDEENDRSCSSNSLNINDSYQLAKERRLKMYELQEC